MSSSLIEQVSHLAQSDFETIEELATQNQAPSDIALALGVSKRAFLHVWRDKKSQIREAYDRGRLQITIDKEAKLMEKVNEGNITAIQIHDRKQAQRRFEDAREDVFGFSSNE